MCKWTFDSKPYDNSLKFNFFMELKANQSFSNPDCKSNIFYRQVCGAEVLNNMC